MDVENQSRRHLRRILGGAAFLLAAASAVAGAVTGRTASKTPRLAISTGSLDLGEGKPNEKLRGGLELTNNGVAPLVFELTATCGCSELSPRKGQIAPGQRQAINIGLQLPRHAPSQQETHVTVQTNDPDWPVVGCHVVARCPSPFITTPRQVDFGELLREQVPAAQATLEITDRNGKSLGDPAALRVLRAPSGVKVGTEQADHGAVRLRVALLSDLPPGDLYGAIQVELAGAEGTVSIPIHVRVVEPISVVPSTVFLRIDPHTQKYCPIELLVVNRRNEKPLGAVSLVAPSAGVTLEEIRGAHASRRRLRLSVPDTLIVTTPTHLRLMFDGSPHEGLVTLVPP
jgi:hypothetical protein